jgi:hypothetical protein
MSKSKQPETIDEAGSILNEIEIAERDLRQADQAVVDIQVLLKAAKDTQKAKLIRLRGLTGARLEENLLFDHDGEEDE